MTWKRQTIELLSPCFCTVAKDRQPEVRVASIRGQLRFWARLLAHDDWEDSNNAKITAEEYALFGGIKGKLRGYKDEGVASRHALRATVRETGVIEPRLTCPHDRQKGSRLSFGPDAAFDLEWTERNTAKPPADSKYKPALAFETVLRTWCLLGGIGLRSNRAAGSVWPMYYKPTVKAFDQFVSTLGLPACVKARVISPPTERESLRREATNTEIRDSFGDIKPRKASPVKFKIGRFDDGFRLIAVIDNRHGRASTFEDDVEGMNKTVAGWLRSMPAEAAPAQEIATASAASPSGGTSAREVIDKLLGAFSYRDMTGGGKIHSQVAAWIESGDTELLRSFFAITQQPKFAGLRLQTWYLQAQAAGGPL